MTAQTPEQHKNTTEQFKHLLENQIQIQKYLAHAIVAHAKQACSNPNLAHASKLKRAHAIQIFKHMHAKTCQIKFNNLNSIITNFKNKLNGLDL